VNEHAHESMSVAEHENHGETHPGNHTRPGVHIGFIENPYIVNPAAILGVFLAIFWPKTKFPHAGHVLLSIWASLSHILMSIGHEVSVLQWAGIVLFLFLAVWLPCCFSDIIFPMVLIKDPSQRQTCRHHRH